MLSTYSVGLDACGAGVPLASGLAPGDGLPPVAGQLAAAVDGTADASDGAADAPDGATDAGANGVPHAAIDSPGPASDAFGVANVQPGC